jgi:thiol-disulfide isomerase/thioredoxin
MLVLVGTALGATAASAWFASRYYSSRKASNEAVRVLMEQRFQTARGEALPMSELRGKVLLVNFWATWCPPCVEEMPELEALQQELQSRPAIKMQTIGIGIDSPSNIRLFAAKSQITYPLVLAGTQGSELARLFGNDKGLLPYTVVIGHDGALLKTVLGRVRIDALRQAVVAALDRA